MIKVEIEQHHILRANSLYEFRELNGSITSGKGNFAGAVGELIMFDFFHRLGLSVDHSSTYDYDLIVNGITIDVKTKNTTVEPEPYHLCSIPSFNTRQKCHLYTFVRIDRGRRIGYILGYIKKDDFFRLATFNHKGDLDINGWEFKTDCYNLEISKLKEFNTIKF